MSEKKYLIRAIDYVNGKPHIGHALEMINIDVLARFYRYQGHDVRMGIGTDEHGQKIEQTAKESNMDTQAFCDMNAQVFKELSDLLNLD